MPYRKYSNRRRRYKRTRKSLSKKQRKEVKAIVKTNAEMKYIDSNFVASVVNAGGTLLGPVTAINQNIGGSQRIGDQIRIENIAATEQLIAGDATNFLRIIWFQWYQNTASVAPTLGAILQNPSAPTYSPINETNLDGKLFRILSDKCYGMTTSGANQCLTLKKRIKPARKVLEFNPTAATGFNHIYCYVMSDSIAAPNPTHQAYVRVQYTDS